MYALVDRIVIDTGASDPIATLTTGGSGSPFTINLIQTFDPTDDLLRLLVVARSTTGSFFTSWNNYFSDLGNSNFADEIAFIGDEGITTGCGAAIYCPKSNVTRAQMAVFLDRALDLPNETDPHPFTDIGTQSPAFQQAIQNLWGAGITGGCTATTFCPNQAVTRGQMSKFIVVGYGLAPIAGAGTFTDDNGHFSEPYNNRMAADGITTGCGATTYCPNSPVLREQMAVFIFRAETED